jgi:hypothetical protein
MTFFASFVRILTASQPGYNQCTATKVYCTSKYDFLISNKGFRVTDSFDSLSNSHQMTFFASFVCISTASQPGKSQCAATKVDCVHLNMAISFLARA